MPEHPFVTQKKTSEILVYIYPSSLKHGSIPTGVKAPRLAANNTKAFYPTSGYTSDTFRAIGLPKTDAILFNNCTKIKQEFSEEEQRKAILAHFKVGEAFIEFYSAPDGRMPQLIECTRTIGGCFAEHPWNAG